MYEALYEQYPLGNAVERHVGGGTPPRQVPSYWEGEIPWASVKDFPEQKGVLQDTEERISPRGLHASASNLIPAQTPLVCTRMAVGRVALPTVPMAINQDVKAIFPASGVSAEYLLKIMQHIQPLAEAKAVGSTVKGIRIQEYLNIPVPLAPQEAQPIIAQILNTLDTAIRETETLIDKLQTVKRGLLHDLLTRGINSNGQLRPPHNEAPQLYKKSPFGWIPREWEQEIVNSLIEGTPRNGIYKPADDIGAGVLLVGQTSFTAKGSVDFNLARRARVSSVECDTFGLQQGDLLVSRVFATREGVGQPVIVPELSEPAVYESNMMRLRVRQSVALPHLLFLWLKHRTARSWIKSRAFASNQASINRETVCSMPVPLIPLEEQETILALAWAQDSRLDNEMCYRTKLKTLRAGLMADLLTGRIRVTPLLESRQPATPPVF